MISDRNNLHLNMYLNQIRKQFLNCNNILQYFSYTELSRITHCSYLHIPCFTVQREM